MRHHPESAQTNTRPQASGDRVFETLPHFLLFVSGGLALVYEVLWLRRSVSVFGATTPATAATLAAVFVGLTAGSAWIGARAERIRRPLRVYGILEISAGLACLLVDPFLLAYDHFYPNLYSRLYTAPVAFGVVKWLLIMAALFAPTFCMGATIPVMAQASSTARAKIGVKGSGLYAANTLGAAFGALSVPFFWLPTFGGRASYLICVVLSVLLGVAAWRLDLRRPRSLAFAPATKESSRDQTPLDRDDSLPTWWLAILAALSGALLFILQVTWTRMFAQVHENSIHSFAVVVAVFILGLAGGAALARAVMRRGGRAKWFLGRAWILGGMAVFVTSHLFFHFTNGLSYVPQTSGWMTYNLHLVWLAVVTLFLPTLLSGTALPLLMELAGRARNECAAKVLGWLLATNTAGVVAGLLLAAFVLPKWLGLWASIAAVGVVMMLAGELSLGEWRRVELRRLGTCAIIILGLSFGNVAKLPRTKIHENRGEWLVDLREGSQGIVSVTEQSGSRRMKLDNFYVLGGTASIGDERMQAHIPLLLHPAPRQVAFLGLGTGITAGAALLHPVERITAVEIVPEVVSAAKLHFTVANLGVVDSPRVEMLVEDARSFLRAAPRKFDVIVGDLVVPWRRGESALYTAEHFLAARRALAPGGLFCQWLPMFQLSREEFRIVVATFLDVFPATTLWRGDFAPKEPVLALIGNIDGAPIDPAMIERRVGELKNDETNPHLIHPAGLWVFLVGPLDPADLSFARAQRNRENQPWLEILGPVTHARAVRGDQPVFVGRALESFLAETRARPLAGFSLSLLQTAQLGWRDAGARLGDATLLLAEKKSTAASELMRAAADLLPPEVGRAMVPEAAAERER